MYFASLWSGQSFLLLPLALPMGSNGSRDITRRKVDPDAPPARLF